MCTYIRTGNFLAAHTNHASGKNPFKQLVSFIEKRESIEVILKYRGVRLLVEMPDLCIGCIGVCPSFEGSQPRHV